MGKVFWFIIFVLIASVIIFYLFFSHSGKSYSGSMEFAKNEHPNKILSMREIDSLTASMNYHFTIKNRIVHAVSPDSVKIPVKQEKPSG
jgi:hypothetical protein